MQMQRRMLIFFKTAVILKLPLLSRDEQIEELRDALKNQSSEQSTPDDQPTSASHAENIDRANTDSGTATSPKPSSSAVAGSLPRLTTMNVRGVSTRISNAPSAKYNIGLIIRNNKNI